jgi:hypothetical protein
LDILRRFHFNRAEFNSVLFHQFDDDEEFQMQIINALPIRTMSEVLIECRHNRNLRAIIMQRLQEESDRLNEQQEPNHDHDDGRMEDLT